jgi:TPR repeat protein
MKLSTVTLLALMTTAVLNTGCSRPSQTEAATLQVSPPEPNPASYRSSPADSEPPLHAVATDTSTQSSVSTQSSAIPLSPANSSNSQVHLEKGWQLEHGLGGPIDREGAHREYLKAAKQGSVQAKVACALQHFLEQVANSQMDKAIQLVEQHFDQLRQIADEGDTRAQVLLGRCYFHGCAVKVTPS